MTRGGSHGNANYQVARSIGQGCNAKRAAEKLGMSLNRFMMQAIFIRVQELPTKREPIVFDKERFSRDNKWIDENYQALSEQYPNKWLYVYDQKVCGADRDMARAERLARAEIGDVHRLGAVPLFTGECHTFF